jgi:ribosomal protein L28
VMGRKQLSANNNITVRVMIPNLIRMAMFVLVEFAFYHLKSARPILRMWASDWSSAYGNRMLA